MFPKGRPQPLGGTGRFGQLGRDGTPLKLPAGSKLTAYAHYDNSPKNKWNPAPDKEVFWSEQSWDEMYQPFTEYSVDSQDLTVLKPVTTQQQK